MRRAICTAAFLSLAACGRSLLYEPRPPEPPPPRLCPTGCDDGVFCTVDACQTDGGCAHTANAARCDDSVSCTVDACDIRLGCANVADAARCDDSVDCTIDSCDALRDCQHVPDQRRCDDSIACTTDVCTGLACMHLGNDAVCSDGVFCNGAEHCEPTLGCAPSGRPMCDDGIACTLDSCDEAAKACARSPDDSRCPMGEFCGTAGCGVFAYAVASDKLYDVQLPSGVVTAIGLTRYRDGGFVDSLNDIALDTDGTLYGLGNFGLVFVDRLTGELTPRRPLNTNLNGLDVLPGGAFYGAGGGTVYSISRLTGALTPVSTLPTGGDSSGDIAVVSGHIFVTVRGLSTTDSLVEIFDDGRLPRLVGHTGAGCIWGLAAYGPVLYGFGCAGIVYRIDVTTAQSTVLSTGGPGFLGASSR